MSLPALTEPKQSSRWVPTRWQAAKIALWYLGLSALWIFSSGWLLHHLVPDSRQAAVFEVVKGWAFVVVTALLLGLALNRYFRHIRQSANQLQHEEARLRLVGDNLPDSYVYQYTMGPDTKRCFTYVSAGVERVHGIKPADVLSDADCLFKLIDPDQIPSYRAAEAQSARDLSEFEMELRATRPNGGVRHIVVRSKPRPGDQNGILWDGFVVDITDRKQAEEKVRELNRTLDQRVQERTAELSASNEELDAFAYAVSHDLRAPLRAMSGFSQALVEDYGSELPPEARGYLSHIQSGSREMGELIDGLLRLSRSTRGSLRRDTVDVSALAARILAELGKAEPDRAVASVVETGLVLNGDARLMEIVFSNLLGNAWKYTGGTAHPEIQIHGRADEAATVICVTDNGAGFDMKHAAKLFLPFQRLHRENEFPGIGIGLATVQRIIRRHGGTIEATGAPGAGATFSIHLPRFKPHENT